MRELNSRTAAACIQCPLGALTALYRYSHGKAATASTLVAMLMAGKSRRAAPGSAESNATSDHYSFYPQTPVLPVPSAVS